MMLLLRKRQGLQDHEKVDYHWPYCRWSAWRGYVFLSQSAQSTAEGAIASVESTIAADIANSDCAFDEFEVNMFDRAANVSGDIPPL